MATTPPSKNTDSGKCPAVCSPSKRSYSDFVNVRRGGGSEGSSDEDEHTKKRLKASTDGGTGSEGEENGNESEPADGDGDGESGDNVVNESVAEGASASSGDKESDIVEDGNEGDGNREDNVEEHEAEEEEEDMEEEEDEPAVCTDCGESPCVFLEAVPTLVQFGIEQGWLNEDFDFEVERDAERAEARGRALVRNPDDLQEMIEMQRRRRYQTYRQYTAFRYGAGVPRTLHPNCVNTGIHRMYPAPHGRYRGPLAERPTVLPEERTEEELFGQLEEVGSDADESEYDIELFANDRH